jgi:hypothetical protein
VRCTVWQARPQLNALNSSPFPTRRPNPVPDSISSHFPAYFSKPPLRLEPLPPVYARKQTTPIQYSRESLAPAEAKKGEADEVSMLTLRIYIDNFFALGYT